MVRDAMTLYGARGLNMSIGLASMMIYGRVFATSGIAVISLFEMVASLFLSFGFSWSGLGIIRYGKEEWLATKTLNRTSSIRLIILLPSIVVSIFALYFYNEPLLSYIGTQDPRLIHYLLANLFLLAVHGHLSDLFTAAEQHAWNALYNFGESLGKLLILVFFVFGSMTVSAEIYLKLDVGLLTGLLVIRLASTPKSYLLPFRISTRPGIVTYFKFVIPQIYGVAGLYLINWVDVYFIRIYCPLDHLGAYQFVYSFFTKFCSFAFILNTILFPRVVAWKQRNAVQLQYFRRSIPILTLSIVSVLMLTCIWLYGYFFDLAFGAKYVVAYPAFNVLLMTVPFYFATYLYVPILNAYDLVAYVQVVNIVSAGTNLMIDFFLINRYGIIAASFGTLMAVLIKCILLMIKTKDLLNASTLIQPEC